MSGFEVAGVVLATVPLFLGATEHCRDGLSVYDRLRNKARILQEYIVELSAQVVLLETTLEGFIAEIALGLSTKRALLESPASEHWRSSSVQAKMRNKCGGKRAYDSIVAQLKKVQDRLSAQLEGDMTLTDFHTLAQSQQTPAEAMNWVKFTWKRPKRKEMLQAIIACIDWLS
jgi:hypothetical protein